MDNGPGFGLAWFPLPQSHEDNASLSGLPTPLEYERRMEQEEEQEWIRSRE
jgi:hypothetical protein